MQIGRTYVPAEIPTIGYFREQTLFRTFVRYRSTAPLSREARCTHIVKDICSAYQGVGIFRRGDSAKRRLREIRRAFPCIICKFSWKGVLDVPEPTAERNGNDAPICRVGERWLRGAVWCLRRKCWRRWYADLPLIITLITFAFGNKPREFVQCAITSLGTSFDFTRSVTSWSSHFHTTFVSVYLIRGCAAKEISNFGVIFQMKDTFRKWRNNVCSCSFYVSTRPAPPQNLLNNFLPRPPGKILPLQKTVCNVHHDFRGRELNMSWHPERAFLHDARILRQPHTFPQVIYVFI